MPFRRVCFQGDWAETRSNIDFGSLECLETMFRNIDDQRIMAATIAKEQLWPGKGANPEQVRENCFSVLRTRED